VNEGEKRDEIHYAFISEDADEALEIIFEHPDGITEEQLARALGLRESAFLIEELHLAGIDVRREIRGGWLYFLAPLRPQPEA
jgi:hypothetical protein